MKKALTSIVALAMLSSMTIPSFANNYSFSSGADYGEVLGKPTSSDEIVTPEESTENIRRNKDAAYFPPSYGVFSGDIPTDPTSLYHDNSMPYSGYSGNTNSANYPDTQTGGSVSPNTGSNYSGVLASTSITTADITNTQPSYFADGSIGTLSIPRFSKTIKVYEGETATSMKSGIGHFSYTSAWDGNVGLAGHNRGNSAYFSFVKDLKNGDIIKYTTPYGTRSYKIISKTVINDSDTSTLGWSDENIITLITCVADKPSLRYSVQAREI